MKITTLKSRVAAALLLLALLLSSLLPLTSCSLPGTETETPPITEEQYSALADSIAASVAEGSSKKYSYAASYLKEWGVPAFNTTKLKTVERYYNSQYIEDLGYSSTDSIIALAKRAAEHYINNELLDEEGNMRLTLDEINDKDINSDAVIRSYVAAIGDKYSVYRNKEQYDAYMSELEGEFAGIGVYVRLDYDAHSVTVIETIKDSAAEKAGIIPGDMLVKIDGKAIADYDLPTFMDFAKGEVDSPVSVTVSRDGSEMTFEMRRVPVEEESVSYSILEGGIAHVVIASFNANTDEQFISIMNGLEKSGDIKGYIFDVRYNGGGYLDTAVNLLSYFVPKDTKIVSQVTRDEEFWHHSNSDHVITKPMVVLCNEYTASAGELFTAAIRDYREMGLINAAIVGVRTYTKGKVQSIFPLSDGSAIVLTIGLFNPPSGVNFDGAGVEPDRTVELTPDPERDNQFDVALEELNKLINK